MVQVPNVTDIGLKPRSVKKVAIIGGGLMGSGIATSLVLSNIFVIIKEINPEYLQKGIKTVEGYISSFSGILLCLILLLVLFRMLCYDFTFVYCFSELPWTVFP